KPVPTPPWRVGRNTVGKADDIEAVEIQGLVWLENASAFEQVTIDERGYPVRIVSFDPRVFAVHKFCVSSQKDRDPLKKARDRQQAEVVTALTEQYLSNLPFDVSDLRMMPRDVVDAALGHFQTK